MKFLYLTPLYGFGPDHRHIAVPANAEKKLREMGDRLAGADDAVAIYIPEGTDDVYQVGNMKGRVVGAVRLDPMPLDKDIQDYFYKDLDGSLRWPIGWPCTAVYAPPPHDCPVLRSVVTDAHGPTAFRPYVRRLLQGPVDLDPKVRNRLERWFEAFPALA